MRGVHSVLPTPFTPSGAVDHESLGRVVELYLAAGVDGVTALGVTSEATLLNGAERAAVLRMVMDQVRGRVPVVVGATAAGTRTCIELSRAAADAGAAAVMVSPPRTPKLDSAAVLRHFHELAGAVDIEIVVQDYPPVAGFSMEAPLLVQICREIPSARTIKLEDPPTPLKTAQILAAADGLRIDILGGLGGGFLFEELLAGAAGAMTGFAYPEILVRVVRAFESGEVDEAASFFYRCVPLMRFEFQQAIGMAIRKEMLKRRGAIAHNGLRAPGLELDSKTSEALDHLLSWMRSGLELTWISA